MLSILAVVTGFAIDAFLLEGRVRQTVSGLFLVGQWSLPFTWWVAFGTGNEMFMATLFLWGSCLLVAMVLMAWQAVRIGEASRASREQLPVDD